MSNLTMNKKTANNVSVQRYCTSQLSCTQSTYSCKIKLLFKKTNHYID